MLHNWLEPIDPIALGIDALPAHALGKQITIYQSGHSELGHVRLALIGVDAAAANAIRTELYALNWAFDNLGLADLGNVRKSGPDFMLPLIRELLESRIFPILLGDDPHQLATLYHAFVSDYELLSLVNVDEQAPFGLQNDKNPGHYLNPILYKRQRLFFLGLIGIQAHFVPLDYFNWLDDRHFECVRLGRARAELSELEPLLRDADLLGFHIRALKRAEAPAQRESTPSGFFLEEACQICRYAGMSDKLKAFSLHGFDASPSSPEVAVKQTAQALAQMVWYFIEGFYNRKQDYPISNEGLTEYIVDLKGRDAQIVFWKSNKSSRWWIQVPVKTSRKYERHRLIPCSYNDYKLACQEELPDRLINAFKRF